MRSSSEKPDTRAGRRRKANRINPANPYYQSDIPDILFREIEALVQNTFPASYKKPNTKTVKANIGRLREIIEAMHGHKCVPVLERLADDMKLLYRERGIYSSYAEAQARADLQLLKDMTDFSADDENQFETDDAESADASQYEAEYADTYDDGQMVSLENSQENDSPESITPNYVHQYVHRDPKPPRQEDLLLEAEELAEDIDMHPDLYRYSGKVASERRHLQRIISGLGHHECIPVLQRMKEDMVLLYRHRQLFHDEALKNVRQDILEFREIAGTAT